MHGLTDARANVAKGLRVENRNNEQQPIRRLARLNVSRQVQSQGMNNLTINAGRRREGNATANHLRLGGEIWETRRLQLSDEPLDGWIGHVALSRSNRYQAKPPSGLAEPGSVYCGARRGQETRETPHGISAQSRNHLRQQRFRVSWFLLFNPNNFRHKQSEQSASYHLHRRTQHRKSPHRRGESPATVQWMTDQDRWLVSSSLPHAANGRTDRRGQPVALEWATDVARRVRSNDFVRPHDYPLTLFEN